VEEIVKETVSVEETVKETERGMGERQRTRLSYRDRLREGS
jgi:hypothetical protein